MISAGVVRRAFKDLTGPQISKRNKAFDEGWRIVDHWCGRYTIGHNGECVARVEKCPNGMLSITIL